MICDEGQDCDCEIATAIYKTATAICVTATANAICVTATAIYRLRFAICNEGRATATTMGELWRQRRGASYSDQGASIGVLVWFCRFGTEALYWGFFF